MKKLLFFLAVLVVIIPYTVNAEIYYWPYGNYFTSQKLLEEEPGMEVIESDNYGQILYRYRHYLELPDEITITDKNFEFARVMVTNLPLESFTIIENYDLNDKTKREALVEIKYLDDIIYKTVLIDIFEEYINLPSEIVITQGDNVNIRDYIETNIKNIDEIKILGEYDVNCIGEYPILVTHNNVEEETKLIVMAESIAEDDHSDKGNDIQDTDDFTSSIEENNDKQDQEDLTIVNEKDSNSSTDNMVIDHNINYSYEIKTYIENKYMDHIIENNIPNEEATYLSCNTTILSNDVENGTIKNNNCFSIFFFVTYLFYGIVFILLSIIVVRKK